MGDIFTYCAYRLRNASGCSDVVVLYKHTVRKVEAVVMTAARAHGIFFQRAQARR